MFTKKFMSKGIEENCIINYSKETKPLIHRSMFMLGEVLTTYLSLYHNLSPKVVEIKDINQTQAEFLFVKVLLSLKRKAVIVILILQLKNLLQKSLNFLQRH